MHTQINEIKRNGGDMRTFAFRELKHINIFKAAAGMHTLLRWDSLSRWKLPSNFFYILKQVLASISLLKLLFKPH